MLSTIHWIVNQISPQAPDSEVEADIRARCTDARERGHDIEPEREEKLVREAIRHHQENRLMAEYEAWVLRD